MDYFKKCAALLNNSSEEQKEVVLAKQYAEERETQEKKIKEAIEKIQADTCLHSVLLEMNKGGEIVANDVFTLWDTLQTHIPVTPQNQGIYQHLIDSAAFAFQLATLKPEVGVSPEKAAFTAILHNAGMLLGPSVEYYRTGISALRPLA
jgi:hypothetical protein